MAKKAKGLNEAQRDQLAEDVAEIEEAVRQHLGSAIEFVTQVEGGQLDSDDEGVLLQLAQVHALLGLGLRLDSLLALAVAFTLPEHAAEPEPVAAGEVAE